EFTKQGDQIIYWVEEGKEEIRFCCSCKNKKEQSSGHRSSMKPMTNAKQSHDYKDGDEEAKKTLAEVKKLISKEREGRRNSPE
ncbi:29599_t:CDS:2, partial [Gigaspora margarita]